MELEAKISELEQRLNYQEQLHQHIDPDGNYRHTWYIEVCILLVVFAVGSIITTLVIKNTLAKNG